MADYDSYIVKTPNDSEIIILECYHCGGDIHDGEEYYEVDGLDIHTQCFSDFCYDYLHPIYKIAGEEY